MVVRRRLNRATSSRRTGRPSGYDPKYAQAARTMCKLGATDADLASAFGAGETAIYVLFDPRYPEDIRYVGKTCNPRGRAGAYRAPCFGSVRLVDRWVHNLRQSNVFPEFYVAGFVEDWEAAERFVIKTLLLAGADLLNVELGGRGSFGSGDSKPSRTHPGWYRLAMYRVGMMQRKKREQGDIEGYFRLLKLRKQVDKARRRDLLRYGYEVVQEADFSFAKDMWPFRFPTRQVGV